MCCKISKLSHKKKKKDHCVPFKVGTYIQLHYLQVAIVTPKGGIAILRSLLTDNPPSPGITLFEQWCGFFYIPQEPNKWKCCETGPTVFCPNLRRQESLTVCRCNSVQGQHFLLSYLKTLSGLNPQPPPWQTHALQWTPLGRSSIAPTLRVTISALPNLPLS